MRGLKITIKNENGKKWIRILSLDKKIDFNLNEMGLIYSFEKLVDDFKTLKDLLPKLVVESNKKMQMSSIEEFFKTNDDTFIVTFQGVNENNLNGSSKIKIIAVIMPYRSYKFLTIQTCLKKAVGTLKSKIAEKEGIQARKQCLIFKDEILEDLTCLEKYGSFHPLYFS